MWFNIALPCSTFKILENVYTYNFLVVNVKILRVRVTYEEDVAYILSQFGSFQLIYHVSISIFEKFIKSFPFFKILSFVMIEGFSSMHMCVTCANRGITGQKTVPQPPQLELQMALVCHVGARDQT